MEMTLRRIDGIYYTFFLVKNKEYKKLSKTIQEILGFPTKKYFFSKEFKCIGDYLNDKDLRNKLHK